jgi:hypothetical protein
MHKIFISLKGLDLFMEVPKICDRRLSRYLSKFKVTCGFSRIVIQDFDAKSG